MNYLISFAKPIPVQVVRTMGTDRTPSIARVEAVRCTDYEVATDGTLIILGITSVIHLYRVANHVVENFAVIGVESFPLTITDNLLGGIQEIKE